MIAWWFVAAFTGASAAPAPQIEWRADDPRRPLIVEVAPSDAQAVADAARTCGLGRQQQLSRSGGAWIVLQDVLASESPTNPSALCLWNWAGAHPRTRVTFFGRLGAANPR
jgi:hypothetical protein